jgi:predicted O-linked N-acetylglucosamine transferase (SPINDLY family)
VRLPDGFLCYTPPPGGAPTRVPPSQRQGHVTFGSFNNLAKISPVCIRLWSRILAAVPGSRLLLKSVGLQDPGLQAMLLDRLVKAGVDPACVTLAAPVPDHREHMRAYDRVDIALDTFPYHGTTTTLDALWMNVPVVTLAGDRHAARVGVSLLHGAGLAELVATSEDEYVSLAAGLAGDRQRLARYAEDLRRRLTASPLTDGKRFAASLERAYASMWEAALG